MFKSALQVVFVVPQGENGNHYTPIYDETVNSIYTEENLIKNKKDTFPWSAIQTEYLPLFNKLVISNSVEEATVSIDINNNTYSTLVEETSGSDTLGGNL